MSDGNRRFTRFVSIAAVFGRRLPRWVLVGGTPLSAALFGSAGVVYGIGKFVPDPARWALALVALALMVAAATVSVRSRWRREQEASDALAAMLGERSAGTSTAPVSD